MTESHAARTIAELITKWREAAVDRGEVFDECADALEALQAEPLGCINCDRSFERSVDRHDIRYYYGDGVNDVGPLCEVCDAIIKVHTRFVDIREALQAAPVPSPIERGEKPNPYPDVAARLQHAAWCGNSVYHDAYQPGAYDARCGACLRALLAIRTLVADIVPRAVSVDDALSSPMAAGLLLQLKAECEAQHARAEAAEQQIVDITTDRESIAEMLHDQEQANIVLMALVETWTSRAHTAEARIEELTAERNDV